MKLFTTTVPLPKAMEATPTDLNAAKKNLTEVLGEEMKCYLQNLKSWFRQKISKEEFDIEARKLLTSETVHLHNEFLLAIISKCQTLSSSLVPRSPPSVHSSSGKLTKKVKLKKKPQVLRSSFQQRFVPVNPMSCAVLASYKNAEETGFVSREMYLPDVTMVHGRVLVCAWEAGLTHADDNSVKLVMQAVEIQLKNIITQILSRRNGYRLREDRFKYYMGTQVPNPYTRSRHLLRNRATESEATMISENGHHIPNKRLPHDCNEGYAAQELSTATTLPQSQGPVTLYNLLETLQTYKGTIASHSVYATAVERILHKLWHPSHEELQRTPQEGNQLTEQFNSTYTTPVR